jgi:hypothetical protein
MFLIKKMSTNEVSQDMFLVVAAVVQLAFALLGVGAAVTICCTPGDEARWDGVRAVSPPPPAYKYVPVQYPPSWN